MSRFSRVIVAHFGLLALLIILVLPACKSTRPAPAAGTAPGAAPESGSGPAGGQPGAASRPAIDPMLAVNTLILAPDDFAARKIDADDFPIPPYARFLKGVKICLDPGHGGDSDKRGFKRGPTGVREAEVNLRVAQYLRELLMRAGAEVKLTRETDIDLSLADRAAVANAWSADLFISLHHNAIDNKPQTNHTTVWYHADVDARPSDLDLARYLCGGLYDTLSLPEIADVPLKSDYLMYPPRAPAAASSPSTRTATAPTDATMVPTTANAALAARPASQPDPRITTNPHGTEGGFGVLRAANVTAALTETSFFTNPAEEQRLRQPEYNLQEAYGVFLGLARYAAAGLPRVKLVYVADRSSPASAPSTGPAAPTAASAPAGTRPIEISLADLRTKHSAEPSNGAAATSQPTCLSLVFELNDGLRPRKSWGFERQMILTHTIAVTIDDQRVPFEFRNEGYRLIVPLPADLAPGEHRVEVQFQNMNKNSVLNPFCTVLVR